MSPSRLRILAVACLCSSLLMSSCQHPPHAEIVDDDAPGGVEAEVFTIRRAESPQNTELFNTGAALNVPRQAASVNDTARMLAGLPSIGGHDAYPDVRTSSGWQSHAGRLAELWHDYDLRHGQPIRRWASREIGDLQRSGSLFYPFSGPDFLFADAFFPHTETIVLCGLEPAEPLPQLASLTSADIEAGLDGLRNSLNSIMQFSFFITKDMRNDLQATRFRGVLPVILVFLARSSHTVESVDSIRLNDNGSPVLAKAGEGATALLIRAVSPNGTSRRVLYFKQDLSNEGFRAGTPFAKFVTQLGRVPVFTKSASYLMHESSFSNIRDYCLQNSRGLVQDPSGTAYEDILRAGLDLRLYGNYEHTLDLFKDKEQPDLAAAYRSRQHGAQPLSFGIGYLYNPANTSLMVARPRR